MLLKNKLSYILCLLGAWWGVSLQAQQEPLQPQTTYYTLNDGLSDRLVTSALQSRFGLVWLATSNGLNRFDGYEFVTFGKQGGASQLPILSAVDINEIKEDKHGNILIFYQNGYAFFEILNPQTHEVRKVVPIQQGLKGIIRHVHVNRAGELFLLSTSQNGIAVWQYDDKANKFLMRFEVKENRTEITPFAQMLRLKDGTYLINDSEKGLRLFSSSGQTFKTFTLNDFPVSQDSLPYPAASWFLHEDRQGFVRVSLKGIPGLFQIRNASDGYCVERLLGKGIYSSIAEDKQGKVLVAESNGVGAYPQILKLIAFHANGKGRDMSYLIGANESITCIHSTDFDKTIFLGMDTGLKVVRHNRLDVKTFLRQNLNAPNVRGAVMRGIVGDGKNLVYMMRETRTWYVLDTKTDHLDSLRLIDPMNGEEIDFTCGIDLRLIGKQLWGITCYYSTQGQLLQYDTELCNTKRYLYKDNFRAFTVDRNGLFWLGCESQSRNGSLVSFDPKTAQFRTIADKNGDNPFKNAVPRYLLEAQSGTIWIGTNDGLFYYDPTSKTVERYADSNEHERLQLSDYTIHVIYEDDRNRLWLGTNNGLNICNLNTREVLIYNKDKGLASNTVCGILPDENENYWISTYNGLSHFNPELENIRSFFQSDGLSHDEFNRFSFFKDHKGRYYFGGVNGVNAFHTDDLLYNTRTLPPNLVKIIRYNKLKDSLLTQYEPALSSGLTIDPYDTYFQVFFALPDYGNPRKSQYKINLDGFDAQWVYLNFANSIRYNSLSPGKYTLRIQGSNGSRSGEELMIPITVRKPFYQRFWFVAIILLALAAGAYTFFMYRLEQKLELERLRMKLSSDLHDEVSGLLSGIAMQSDMLQLIVKEEDSKARLHIIGEASRKAMSKLSDVIWSVDSRKDKVEDLIQRMREHADDILLPMDVTYDLTIDKIDLQQKMAVHLRQNLYFIYNEAINNIAKHANASKVWIEFVNAGNIFEMSIKDNGNGRARSSTKTGQGLSNIQMRAQRLNASLQIIRDNGYTIKLTMRKFA